MKIESGRIRNWTARWALAIALLALALTRAGGGTRAVAADAPAAAGSRVEGVVMGAEGKPLKDVEIQVREVPRPGQTRRQARSAQTDAQGRYRVDGIAWTYKVSALKSETFDAHGIARHQTILLPTTFTRTQTVNFKFAPFPTGGARLAGQVRDEKREAVKAFTLSLASRGRVSEVGKEERDFGFNQSVRSEEGKFSLEGLPAGTYNLIVIPSMKSNSFDYLNAQQVTLKDGPNELKIQLGRQKKPELNQLINPAAAAADALAIPATPLGRPDEISGVVTDEKGRPLEGVLVDLWTWYKGDETKTDKEGRFHLVKFSEDHGKVEIRFMKENYSPLLIPQQPTGALSKPVVLGNRTWLAGQLTAAGGKPVADALIRANQGPVQGPGVMISTVWTEARSDRNGRYKMFVQDGRYDIQVSAPGGLAGRLQGITVKKNEAKPLDIPVFPGLVFRARVIDSQTSQPVAGVRLWDWQRPGVDGRSGADGMLRIEGLQPGSVQLSVESADYARWWSKECVSTWNRFMIDEQRGGWQRNFDSLDFDIREKMEPVTVVVEKTVRITGRILDPDGKPVAGATAAPARTGSGNSLTGDTRFSVKTKVDGTFEMLLPASNGCEYNLVAHDGDYGEWRTWANGVLEPIQTKPGQTIEGVDLRLTRPATVKGRVVDAAGKPVAGREVRASAYDRLENRYYDPTTKTDSDGKFELNFIRAGQQYIQAAPFWLNAKEAPEASSQLVILDAGQTREGVQLVAGEDR